jgi:hypothetical protein
MLDKVDISRLNKSLPGSPRQSPTIHTRQGSDMLIIVYRDKLSITNVSLLK